MPQRHRVSLLLVSPWIVLAACWSTTPSMHDSTTQPSLSGGTAVSAPLPRAGTNRRCLAPRPHLIANDDRPLLGAYPAGVTAVWFAGLDHTRCAEPNTRGGPDLARRLVRDIATATPWAPGNYSCPGDNGRSVVLYFRYPRQAEAETVTLSLAGCATIVTSRDAIGLHIDTVLPGLRALEPSGFGVP